MNRSVLFWLLLVVDGVFAVDDVKSVSVSVLVGDSVTLNTDDTEIQGAEALRWKIQDETQFIAEIDKEAGEKPDVPGNNDKRFKGRLELDGQTGSLTITNLKTTDSRVYELHIKKKESKYIRFNVTVRDVVESVSVMEGDSITLHTDVKVKGDDQILWKFGDQGTIIARLNGPADGRWSNVHLNDQTGELTFRNIQSNQTGVYKMEFNTSSMISHRKFRIDISDAVKTVSVMEGESVTVPTGVTEIQGYDQILWKFKENSVAEINKGTNLFLVYDSDDVRFKGRLKLSEKSGSLIISNSRATDSGDYHLNMSSSSHFLQRTISVTVNEFQFMSVKDGDSVTLQTNTKTQSEDLILWTFGPSTCIAQINRTITLYDNALNGKFRDRLKLDRQTGSLTITNTRTTDSGLYQLEISSSSKEPIYTRFSVAVSESGLSPGAVAGIAGAVVVILVAAGVALYHRRK